MVQYGLFSPLRYLAVFAVTALYFLALVSIVISVSAIVRRTTTAAATLFIGFILILEIFWQMFVPGLYSRLTGVPVNPYDPPAEGGLFLMDRLSRRGVQRRDERHSRRRQLRLAPLECNLGPATRPQQ